ncbi:histone-like nucleoid-structuring protein Lsr2 [Streptomyces sp. LARHCF249]
MTEHRRVGAGQPVGATGGEHSGSNAPDLQSRAEPPEWELIRAWAGENGYLVNHRGRVLWSIREAYEQAEHRDR